jgi:hypothetical protein
MMTLQELDTVVLERDLPTHGLRRGDVGAVVLVHGPDVVEVEFVRASGRPQALVELATSDLRPVAEDDLLAVRPLGPTRRGAA